MDKKNKEKTILSLCSGSGAWEKPYVEAGYNVISVTLPDNDVRTYKPPENVYGILAAPPCTMFSLSRTRAKKERDFEEGMGCVKACLDIIWTCRYRPLYRKDGSLKFWALENPTGFLRQFLGKPAFVFQPYEFGDNSKKRTDLWGYFNIPKKSPIPKPNYERKGKTSWAYQYSTPRQKERAITPANFAQAFYEVNK